MTITTRTTKVVAGIYEVHIGLFTFRIERTQNRHAEFTSEGWHLFQTFDNGSEDYWNTFPTKASAIAAIVEELS